MSLTMIRQQSFLITRPLPEALQTAQHIALMGGVPLIDPLLFINPILDQQNLIYQHLDQADALIISSANALVGIKKNAAHLEKSLFIVGSNTAKKCVEFGFKNIKAIVFESAELPLAIMQNKTSKDKNFLHLTAHDAHNLFYNNLEKEGLSIRTSLVYEAKATDQLSEVTQKMIVNHLLSGVLFYSARTASIFKKLLKKYDLCCHINQTEAFCLSHAIAEQLNPNMWKNIIIAEKPEHEMMLLVLRDFLAKPGC